VISLLDQRAKTANVAHIYETLPPNALEVSLARCAIAPLMPALATFANKDSPSPPAQSLYFARPRSIVRVLPESATSMARSIFRGSPSERAKSQPVPRGITAISMPARPPIPFTTSFTDPSPPTTTSNSAPSSAARRANSVSSPAAREKSASPSRPAAAARRAISGQRLPVEPFADAGLMRKTVLDVVSASRRP